MTGLDDRKVLAMVSMGAVAAGRHDASDPAVIEGKGAEELVIRMIGKSWLSSEQNAREGMILPSSNP